jgi:pimeloyl-ACP methyl ester carboxylesterase
LARPLVFVHGFACTHADWQPLAAHFGARHPVFTPDLRGHGATHARPEDCSIETYGADIAALLEGKDLKGAVLIGHSMGCRVVLQAYRDAPDRVAALALIDGSFRGGGGDPAAAEHAGRAAIDADGYADFQRRLFEGMFLAPSALAQDVVARAMRLPEAVGAALHPRVARWDTAHMAAALSAVKVPLLVIQTTSALPGGKRVCLSPGESSPWLDLVRRHAPHARIEIIPGMGHFPQLEAPEVVNNHLEALINA